VGGLFIVDCGGGKLWARKFTGESAGADAC